MKRMQWFAVFFCILFLVSGCGEAQVKRENVIPDSGVVRANVFETLKSTGDLAIFKGQQGEILYQWTFLGADIANPRDTNLFINYSDGEEYRQEYNADKVLSFSFPSTEVREGNPSISITPNGDWQVERVEIYVHSNGLFKVCDAEWTDGTATFSLSSYDGLFYLVGRTTAQGNVQDEKQDEAVQSTTEPSQVPSTEASSLPAPEKSTDRVQNRAKQTKEQVGQKSQLQTTAQSQPQQEEKKTTVTISIRCDKAVESWEKLDSSVKDERIVPKSGVILPETKVEISENDTVFDVLKRICKEKKIHMESTNTPVYGSAYIEGINNLYEFHCGPLSGWMYAVNGKYANYGSSKCVLKDGDVVRWDYTCDLGRDLGKEIIR